jgi:peptide deformylase
VTFVLYPDPVLQQKAQSAVVTADLLAAGERLLLAARQSRAYGLAAAHIGEAAPVIVLNVTPEASEPDYLLLFNPRIEAAAEEREAGDEASVSLPGVQVRLPRPVWVDVAFDDFKGQARSLHFESFLARCVCHEIDQMNGIFFLSHLSKLKRDMALRKYRKTHNG